jgi:hypothetical protein
MEFEAWGWFFVAMGLQASWIFLYELGLNRGVNQVVDFIVQEQRKEKEKHKDAT